MVKVRRSRNKIVEPKLLLENERTNLFFYPDDSEILETWNRNSSFKYFQVVRIEKQICLFVFWEKLRLDNFVPWSTDLYPAQQQQDYNIWLSFIVLELNKFDLGSILSTCCDMFPWSSINHLLDLKYSTFLEFEKSYLLSIR